MIVGGPSVRSDPAPASDEDVAHEPAAARLPARPGRRVHRLLRRGRRAAGAASAGSATTTASTPRPTPTSSRPTTTPRTPGRGWTSADVPRPGGPVRDVPVSPDLPRLRRCPQYRPGRRPLPVRRPGLGRGRARGLDGVFRSETEFIGCLGRTGLDGPDDLPNVEALQEQYAARAAARRGRHGAASARVGRGLAGVGRAARPESRVHRLPELPAPVLPAARPVRAGAHGPLRPRRHRSGVALRRRVAGRRAAERRSTPGSRTGIAGWTDSIHATHSSVGLFGSRATLGQDYLRRATAAAMGIYGNNVEEAIYIGWHADEQRAAVDGRGLLHGALPGRPAPAGQALLVDHHVRAPEPAAGRQPDRPVLDRGPHRGPGVRAGRLPDPDRAARRAAPRPRNEPTGCPRPPGRSPRSSVSTDRSPR